VKQSVIVGAGPAGLTAALEFLRYGRKPTVLERSEIVGGISCTRNHNGFLFDMGGHRFFTKYSEVRRIWDELLPRDFTVRRRLSRIYHRGKFFSYPLKAGETFLKLGPLESLFVVASYLRWQAFPFREEKSFEQWVTNRFGRRLYRSFFKAYTEKVWGIRAAELSGEWAAQRISGLTLREAILNMFNRSNRMVRTLIHEFHYPLRGPGMLWESARDTVVSRGGSILHGMEAVTFMHNGSRIEKLAATGGSGTREFVTEHLVSCIAVDDFLLRLAPIPPNPVMSAAAKLRYRAFVTVCLVVDRESIFPDQWIYIQDPSIRAGRIQNFKNWSPAMVPDLSRSGLGMEYFCEVGDELWRRTDEEMIELGKEELCRLGFAEREEVSDAVVYRIPKAYPVYTGNYVRHIELIKDYLSRFENFQTIGRNGLFRYNNMDHSMLTALLAVRNLVNSGRYDVWSVNEDKEYLEKARGLVS